MDATATIIAFPKKSLPFTLAGIYFAVSILAVCLFASGHGNDMALGAAALALGGTALLFWSRGAILQIRDGLLLVYGVAIPVASIRAARIMRPWIDGGPARLLELSVSEKPALSWHARIYHYHYPGQWFASEYTPPPEPYMLFSIPETDLSDTEIVNAIMSRAP